MASAEDLVYSTEDHLENFKGDLETAEKALNNPACRFPLGGTPLSRTSLFPISQAYSFICPTYLSFIRHKGRANSDMSTLLKSIAFNDPAGHLSDSEVSCG